MITFEKVYKIVSSIPKGKVATYKQIADLCGIKNPRIVGFALHANKNPKQIPCHRVVNSKGELAKGYTFGGKNKQRERLQKEGINFLERNRVDLARSGFFYILM